LLEPEQNPNPEVKKLVARVYRAAGLTDESTELYASLELPAASFRSTVSLVDHPFAGVEEEEVDEYLALISEYTETADRRSASDMSASIFNSEYKSRFRPVVIAGGASRWPASKLWRWNDLSARWANLRDMDDFFYFNTYDQYSSDDLIHYYPRVLDEVSPPEYLKESGISTGTWSGALKVWRPSIAL